MEKSSLLASAKKGVIHDLREFHRGYVLNLLERLIYEFRYKHPLNEDVEQCSIYIPGLLTRVLAEDLIYQKAFVGHFNLDTFHGYKILPGYEYGRIIIAHKSHPDTNNPDLFHSVNVVESVDLKE